MEFHYNNLVDTLKTLIFSELILLDQIDQSAGLLFRAPKFSALLGESSSLFLFPVKMASPNDASSVVAPDGVQGAAASPTSNRKDSDTDSTGKPEFSSAPQASSKDSAIKSI